MRYSVQGFNGGISIKFWAAVPLGNAASVTCCSRSLHAMDLIGTRRKIKDVTKYVRSKLAKMCFVRYMTISLSRRVSCFPYRHVLRCIRKRFR